jgi:hypothetical protein
VCDSVYLLLDTTPQQSTKITEKPGYAKKEQENKLIKKSHFNNITKDYKGNKYRIIATWK